MLKEWQFNTLFLLWVGSAIFLLIGPSFGLDISNNPVAFTGVGAFLTYILTQKERLIKHDEKDNESDKKVDDES